MAKIKVLDNEITIINVNNDDFNYGEYATITSKADILDVALFGLTAKEWREFNPKLKT